VLFVALALLVGASLALNLRAARSEYEALARAAADAVLEEMVAARRWNAGHGGVYVPVGPGVEPNPYLEDPLRDVVTTGGLRLTKLNPAYMTRLIARELAADRDVRLHLTSLSPLRPQNAPDAWERAALEGFERGETEAAAVVPDGAGRLYRAMIPLRVQESCLGCHEKQGYRLGDLRGGLAVAFPYGPYELAERSQSRRAVAGHLLFLGAALAMILVLGRSLVRGLRRQREAQGRIRQLEGLLPVCAACKRVRLPEADPRVQESWEPIEVYLRDHADTSVTHGMCPECAREYFGEHAGR